MFFELFPTVLERTESVSVALNSDHMSSNTNVCISLKSKITFLYSYDKITVMMFVAE